MQPFIDIERTYEKADPWGYQQNPEDAKRKRYILQMLNLFGHYSRALDLGCGEGWITKDIPAGIRYGYELSNHAAKRFPPNVIRELAPSGKYDLILATGVLYPHYNWQFFLDVIERHASRYVLTCNIADWEVPEVERISGFRLLKLEFPYSPREGETFMQRLRMFER